MFEFYSVRTLKSVFRLQAASLVLISQKPYLNETFESPKEIYQCQTEYYIQTNEHDTRCHFMYEALFPITEKM